MLIKPFFGVLLFFVFISLLLGCIGCDNAPSSSSETGPVWVTITRASSPLLDNKINDLSPDTEGKMWIATDSGANAYFNGTWSTYKDSLAWQVSGSGGGPTYARSINSISENYGGVWFGTRGGGLVRFNRSSSTKVWTKFTTSTGLPASVINWVAGEFAHGEVWAATAGGAARYVPSLSIPDEGVWETFTSSNSPLPSNNIKVAEVNISNNTVWLGTYEDGLVYFNGDNQWQVYSLPPQYDVHITSIAFDGTSRVWVGRGLNTDGGISALNVSTSSWTHYTHDEGTNTVLPRGPVNAVATNQTDKRWFGTNKGLVLRQDTTWSIFTRSNTPELPSDTIRSLAYDRRGNLWIGTYKGITVYNPEGTKLK